MPCLTHTSWPLIICWRLSSRFSLTLNLLENPWNLKTNSVCELYLEHDACLASLYIDHVKVASKHYRIAGNFRKVQIFAIFATHDQNAKIRTAKYEPGKFEHVNF